MINLEYTFRDNDIEIPDVDIHYSLSDGAKASTVITSFLQFMLDVGYMDENIVKELKEIVDALDNDPSLELADCL